ncbi:MULTISPECIES: hypothetical protein [unclassified Sphaerospermopsis]|jgi:hypothetical protein|uniref:hypothetical protein n=1 Tax=unclassified Sphaerospermopsis TaxID=2646443 RepID=UPI0016814A8F|nr:MULTISPECIES: hypothetical protein [unclassified Sphaerospermopsis]MBD2131444.1 hypothetical protein [Sphaerospermopsis sp. FACHB-1094]MBD2147839.1 hypothetical protein [Sphaerospermopsis sp. FACHB-1194]
MLRDFQSWDLGDREQGTGNREQVTGDSKECLPITHYQLPINNLKQIQNLKSKI